MVNMFGFLPSLLNTWQLPGIAAGALSSALQRRVLLYLLKRTLGHLIKDNDIKLDQIDANSFGGRLEVRGVHLDAIAISKLLPTIPCRLESGLVGSIIIQLPWPNLFTGDLSIVINELTLHFLLDASATDHSQANLHESLASLAEETLYQDPDGIELEESIQSSIIEETDADSAQAVSTNGYVAGIVDSLLTRLKVSINDLKVNLKPSSDAVAELQLRIRLIQVGSMLQASEEVVDIIRTASFDQIQLYLYSTETSYHSESQELSEDADDSGSESNYMAMSQAIPDLRSSQAGSDMFHSTISGANSMYASAIGDAQSKINTTFQNTRNDQLPAEQLLLSFGSDPVLVTFTVIRPKASSEKSNIQRGEAMYEIEEEIISSMKMSLDVSIGNLIGYLTPRSLCSIMRFIDESAIALNAKGDIQAHTAVPRRSIDEVEDLPELITVTSCRGLDLICVYEDVTAMTPAQQDQLNESLQSYWSQPSKVHPQAGHIRMKLQGLRYDKVTTASKISAKVTLDDLAIYEHLSPSLLMDTTNRAAILPILLFDYNLNDQYSTNKTLSDTRLPSLKLDQDVIDCIDWRHLTPTLEGGSSARVSPYWRTSYGDRAWKVRPKHRRTSSVTSTGKESRSVLSATIDNDVAISAFLAPLHIFADVSLVDRLLPLLGMIGKTLQSKELISSAPSDSITSIETVQQDVTRQIDFNLTELIEVDLTCSLVRIEVRMPNSLPLSQSRRRAAYQKRTLGLEVRAGILLIDAHNISIKLGQAEEQTLTKTAVHFGDIQASSRLANKWSKEQKEIALCSVDCISAYYRQSSDQYAKSFASIGMIKSTSEEQQIEKPLRPRLHLYQQESFVETVSSRSFVDGRVPLVNVCISKPLLDGLELLVDDFRLWSSSLSKAEEDRESSESTTEALKIIGSRFFGAKYSYSALSQSSASMELIQKSNNTPAFSLAIDDIFITLIVPRKDDSQKTRCLTLTISDFKSFIDTKHGPRSTLIDATILGFSLDDATDPDRIRNLVSRTLEPSMSRGLTPMLSFQLLSTTDADTTYRESQCDLLLQAFTFSFDGNVTLLDDLLIFSKSPEGAFEHVEPNEVTRLALRLCDISLYICPEQCEARAALSIGDLLIRTKLMPDARQTTIRGQLSDAILSLIEKEDEEEHRRHQKTARNSLEYWHHQGYAKALIISSLFGSVKLNSLTRPEMDIKMNKVEVEILACADTMQIVESLYNALLPEKTASVTRSSAVERVGSNSYGSSHSSDSRDLLASLDEDAFRGAKGMSSIPDLLEDDLPHHSEYLTKEHSTSKRRDEVLQTLESELLLDDDSEEEGEPITSGTKEKKSVNVVLQTDVVTVRLLDSKGITPTPNYLTSLQLAPDSDALIPHMQSSSLRVRIQDFNLAFRMFAGYDCPSTRSAVEEEVKRVKRRLQKIKQMMDQGQTPDDSVEEATAHLMESIHIPLPVGTSAGDIQANEMLQAMEGEFGDQSETASSASTWKQFIPGRSASAMLYEQSTKRKKSKLARSKKSLIDVECRGVSLEYDQYSPEDLLSSRCLLQSRTFQILDNVKTSTWKTFLTSMASTHPISSHQAKDMVKVELVHVRPAIGASVEVRCRARLSPLRLHVDQDALDFIKKFTAFKSPNALPDPPMSPSSRVEPFIQHAEIFPIKIKLDYKPKRVDYNLLREGKTIEMMNFFNFEGSEMTLRHVTIRGINGWNRFFETLQDIWTPDVKSNQLADVLSGISPIRSLVNVGNGVADLILLPIEHYQRDGRLSKGLKAGAKSFVKSTMLEAARIGARLATGTQVILEQTEVALAGGQSSFDAGIGRSSSLRTGSSRDQKRAKSTLIEDDNDAKELVISSESSEEEEASIPISRYANQPANLMQALTEAQQDLTKGFHSAAQTILAIPMEVYERRGGEGGSGPVIRAVPIAVLKSAAGASGAVGKTLQGIQRGLTGTSLEEEEDKYKRLNQSAKESKR